MDPLSVIVGALAAGAVAGTQDAASSSIKDAYAKLKSLVHNKLRGRRAAETALAEHEKQPEAWESALKLELAKAGVDEDPALLARAHALLAAARVDTSAAGDAWNIDARNSSHSQFGHGNTQYNQLPPRAEK